MGIESIVSKPLSMPEQDNRILPLYHFFERLRLNDFVLGIGEYGLLIEALQKSTGISMTAYTSVFQTLKNAASVTENSGDILKAHLLRLCKLIWLKPGQSTRLFEDLFEETFSMDFSTAEQARAPVTPISNIPEVQKETAKPGVQTSTVANDPSVIPASESISEKQDKKASLEPIAVRLGVGEKTAGDRLSLKQENDKELEKSKFLFTHNYFPVDNRKIQQNLRVFPSFRQFRHTTEVDLDATIRKVIAKGLFDEVVFKSYKQNITHLLILADHEGSMVAFEQLTDNLINEVEAVLGEIRGSNSKTLKTFYFYNVWGKYLYANKAHTIYSETDKEIGRLKNKYSSVIIISDAGAAKGTYNDQRITATQQMLARLKDCTGKIAWLNPMPVERWKNTSAEKIAQITPMFEANENGIKNAVRLLKGTLLKK